MLLGNSAGSGAFDPNKSYRKFHSFREENGVRTVTDPQDHIKQKMILCEKSQKTMGLPRTTAEWTNMYAASGNKTLVPCWDVLDRFVLRVFVKSIDLSEVQHLGVLYYYMADDTLEVHEGELVEIETSEDSQTSPRTLAGPVVNENESSQGEPRTFRVASGHKVVSRHVDKRIDPRTSFKVGNQLSLYGRVYTVLDADAFTRDQIKQMSGQDIGFSSLSDFVNVTGIPAKREKSLSGVSKEEKAYRACLLGRAAEDVQKTRQFLENDKKVLRFFACKLEKREAPTGRKYSPVATRTVATEVAGSDSSWLLEPEGREFAVLYYLGDSTLEVREVIKPNCGRTGHEGVFLKRGKLATIDPARDLAVGKVLKVPNGSFFLFDADGFTREHYAQVLSTREPLAAAVDPKDYFDCLRDSLAFVGLGVARQRSAKICRSPNTINDSAHICGTDTASNPSAKSVAAKQQEHQGKIIKFVTLLERRDSNSTASAKKESSQVSQDVTSGPGLARKIKSVVAATSVPLNESISVPRRFIVSHYLEDGTWSVFEVANRNSGYVGGRVLERGYYSNEITGKPLSPNDFLSTSSGSPRNTGSPRNMGSPRNVGSEKILVGIMGRVYRLESIDRNARAFFELGPIGVQPPTAAALGRSTESDAATISVFESVLRTLSSHSRTARDIFRRYDSNHNQRITQTEFAGMLAHLGFYLPAATVLRVFRMFDVSGDGILTFEELARIVSPEGYYDPCSPRPRNSAQPSLAQADAKSYFELTEKTERETTYRDHVRAAHRHIIEFFQKSKASELRFMRSILKKIHDPKDATGDIIADALTDVMGIAQKLTGRDIYEICKLEPNTPVDAVFFAKNMASAPMLPSTMR